MGTSAERGSITQPPRVQRRGAPAAAERAPYGGAPAPGVPVGEELGARRVTSIPRTRGLLGGLGIMLLGLWGALVPFVGPYFHYAFINHKSWDFTYGRLWLEILPGALAFIAGLELMRSANRPSALLASIGGSIAGAWFVLGPSTSMLWNHGFSQAGRPLGASALRSVEQLGYFYATGALILFLAATVFGRLTVVSVRDLRVAHERSRAAAAVEEPAARGRYYEQAPAASTAAVAAPAYNNTASTRNGDEPVPAPGVADEEPITGRRRLGYRTRGRRGV